MARPQLLLVEDESVGGLDLTRQLTRWGYAVTRVASGMGRWTACRRRPLSGRGDPALLDAVQTPPPAFTLAKPFSEAALQDIIGQAVMSWPDRSPV